MGFFTFPEPIELFPHPLTGRIEQSVSHNMPGRVYAWASSWPATLYHPDFQTTLLPDDEVVVVGLRGITLLVMPSGVEGLTLTLKSTGVEIREPLNMSHIRR